VEYHPLFVGGHVSMFWQVAGEDDRHRCVAASVGL
jgi:hypothetical protein